jgi:GGDEF domain-containing protein
MNISANLKASLAKEISRAHRYNTVFSFIIVKLEGKRGEGLIKKAGLLLRDSLLRDVDVVGRISGGRFGLILPQTSRPRALVACKRIKEAFNEEFGEGVVVHTGVSTYPFEAMGIEGLLKAAKEDLEKDA